MKVREVMTKHPICCTPDTTLEAAACLMCDCDCGAIPVVGDLLTKMPIGIITDRDIVVRGMATGRRGDTPVRDCMTAPAHTITEDAELSECLELLEERQIRRVLVVDGAGGVSGIVAQADIASHASKKAVGELIEQVSRPTTSDGASSRRFVRYHDR